MIPHHVQLVLTEEFDAIVEEQTYEIDPERKLVVLIEHTGGIMQVPRIHTIRFTEHYLVLTTEDDRYYVVPECIFGLKAGDPSLERPEKRPGFHR